MSGGAWSIVSDAAVEKNRRAAAACIVSSPDGASVHKYAAILPEVSSAEAELIGGILGLAAAYPHAAESRERPQLNWRCDNQTIIATANRVIAMQQPHRSSSELWAFFLRLSQPFVVECCFVASDSGNVKQRACDRASRWVSRSGKKLLARHGQGPIGRLRVTDVERAWRLLDVEEAVIEISAGNGDFRRLISRIDSL